MEITARHLCGDVYYTATHETGLKIYVYPKDGYSSAYAMFGTAYGSIDTTFKRSDEPDFVTVPEGIAHFLEHKLFESEDGDAFSRYAKTGASANAFTSFDKTCYLFSCTDHFKESLEILLDFVQSPYFTEQTVQKEQGIIGQEIRMYDDDPEWRALFGLLESMYHVNPVRINIAGTVDSISKITADLLYRCYRTFYSLGNMALTVVGRVEPQEVFELTDKMLKKDGGFQVEKKFPEEPLEVVEKRVEERLSVAVPLFQLGFKEKAGERRATEKELACTEILLELLASEASPLYRRLMDKGWINPSFSYEYFEIPGTRAVLFGGESANPDGVTEEINREICSLREKGIPVGAFERAKKAVYGRKISSLGNVQSIARNLMECSFAGRSLENEIAAVRDASLQDVAARLEEQLVEEYSSLSVVLPK